MVHFNQRNQTRRELASRRHPLINLFWWLFSLSFSLSHRFFQWSVHFYISKILPSWKVHDDWTMKTHRVLKKKEKRVSCFFFFLYMYREKSNFFCVFWYHISSKRQCTRAPRMSHVLAFDWFFKISFQHDASKVIDMSLCVQCARLSTRLPSHKGPLKNCPLNEFKFHIVLIKQFFFVLLFIGFVFVLMTPKNTPCPQPASSPRKRNLSLTESKLARNICLCVCVWVSVTFI